MARGYRIDAEGFVLYYGAENDKGASATPDLSRNDFITDPCPDEETHKWDRIGLVWVEDATRKKIKDDREARRSADGTALAGLRAKVGAGGSLTTAEVRQAVEALLGVAK